MGLTLVNYLTDGSFDVDAAIAELHAMRGIPFAPLSDSEVRYPGCADCLINLSCDGYMASENVDFMSVE